MHGWTKTAALALIGGLLALLPACKQSENERCQINDDCADGLYCELSTSTPTLGGYCKSSTASPADLAMTIQPDLAPPPPPPDMAASSDM